LNSKCFQIADRLEEKGGKRGGTIAEQVYAILVPLRPSHGHYGWNRNIAGPRRLGIVEQTHNPDSKLFGLSLSTRAWYCRGAEILRTEWYFSSQSTTHLLHNTPRAQESSFRTDKRLSGRSKGLKQWYRHPVWSRAQSKSE
jgi:hypothetical protein